MSLVTVEPTEAAAEEEKKRFSRFQRRDHFPTYALCVSKIEEGMFKV